MFGDDPATNTDYIDMMPWHDATCTRCGALNSIVHHNYSDRWCRSCRTQFAGRPCCAGQRKPVGVGWPMTVERAKEQERG